MRTQSPELIAEKKKQNVRTFWLIKIGDNYHYTDCDQELSYGGDTYAPWPMKLSGFRASDGSPLDNGKIQLGNVTLALSAMVLNNSIKNAIVKIHEAWYDDSMTEIAVEMVAAGKVDGRPGLDERWCEITVATPINPWTQRCPRLRITKTNFPFLPAKGQKLNWGGDTITIG
jgi:hypothetical protein